MGFVSMLMCSGILQSKRNERTHRTSIRSLRSELRLQSWLVTGGHSSWRRCLQIVRKDPVEIVSMSVWRLAKTTHGGVLRLGGMLADGK